MTTTLTLWMSDADANNKQEIRLLTACAWSLIDNEFGKMTASGPLTDDLDPDTFKENNRIELFRSVDGGQALREGDTQFLLKAFSIGEDGDGAITWALEAWTAECLMLDRIVDYPASTETVTNAYSTKNDYADDMLKAVVNENYSALATDADRRIEGLNIDADTSQGPSITKSFSREVVYDVCKKVCDASAAEGTYLAWGLVPDESGTNFTFRTWTGQRGTDRTDVPATAQPLTLSKKNGNLKNCSLTWDWRQEKTFIRSAGTGEGDNRALGSAIDTVRAGRNRWGRKEALVEGGNTTSTTTLNGVAKAALENARPLRVFTGKFIDSDNARYGQDLAFGDLVLAEFLGYVFKCRVEKVSGQYDGDGEQLDIELHSEEYEE